MATSSITTTAYAGLRPSPLRAYRLTLGLTQAELGQLAGVARITVGALEREENTPTLTTARALARALGVEVADLFPESERG